MKYLIILLALSGQSHAQESKGNRILKAFAQGFNQGYNNYQPQPQIIPPQINIQHNQPQHCVTQRNAMTNTYYTTCN